MLRMLGGILIITGCSGLGLGYRRELWEGLKHLRKLRELFEMLMSEISYHKSTLPEACLRTALHMEEPYREKLIKLHELSNACGEVDFAAAWKQEMGECVAPLPLSAKEKELVLGFVSTEGLSDYHMQIRMIEQYRDMLEDNIKRREAEIQKQGRMAMGLGVMSGLLLVVIFL